MKTNNKKNTIWNRHIDFFFRAFLGNVRMYIILLFQLKNIDYGHSLEPPRRGGSNEYPKSIFWAEIWKISDFFFSENVHFFGGKIFNTFE